MIPSTLFPNGSFATVVENTDDSDLRLYRIWRSAEWYFLNDVSGQRIGPSSRVILGLLDIWKINWKVLTKRR